MASVSVKLPDSLKRRIEERTEEDGYMNTSEYIRQAVREKIEEGMRLHTDELNIEIEGRHRKAFEDFADTAKKELGDSLEELILYGSVARGDQNKESDVDVFAVVETEDDLEYLRELAFDIGVLKHGISISVQGELSENFSGLSDTSYLRNIDRDGVKYA